MGQLNDKPFQAILKKASHSSFNNDNDVVVKNKLAAIIAIPNIDEYIVIVHQNTI